MVRHAFKFEPFVLAHRADVEHQFDRLHLLGQGVDAGPRDAKQKNHHDAEQEPVADQIKHRQHGQQTAEHAEQMKQQRGQARAETLFALLLPQAAQRVFRHAKTEKHHAECGGAEEQVQALGAEKMPGVTGGLLEHRFARGEPALQLQVERGVLVARLFQNAAPGIEAAGQAGGQFGGGGLLKQGVEVVDCLFGEVAFFADVV